LALPDAVSTAVGSRKSVGKLATAEKPEICSKDTGCQMPETVWKPTNHEFLEEIRGNLVRRAKNSF
jgi:hypothetical protein